MKSKLLQFSTFSFKTYVLLSLAVMVAFSSCKDDEEPETCANISKIEGSITLDGNSQDLTIAIFSANSVGGGFDDMYGFQITSIDNDCSELTTLGLNVEIPQGDTFGGTYPIKDFFDADLNDAFGTVQKQQLDPVTITSLDMDSGTATIVNNGNNNFTITIDAILTGGADLNFEMTHSF